VAKIASNIDFLQRNQRAAIAAHFRIAVPLCKVSGLATSPAFRCWRTGDTLSAADAAIILNIGVIKREF
jgi:hypothetical protein